MFYNSLFDGETKIVWNFDPRSFPFVREALASTKTKNRPITTRATDGRVVVGYAQTRFAGTRRFFYLMPYDCTENAGHPPMEAVDPQTVEAGFAGAFTTRCKREPTPEQAAQIAEVFAQRDRLAEVKRQRAKEQRQRNPRAVKRRCRSVWR